MASGSRIRKRSVSYTHLDVYKRQKVESIGWADVIRIMTEDNMQAGREMSREIRENAIEDSENGNPMFGRTRGVLSNICLLYTSLKNWAKSFRTANIMKEPRYF